MIFDREDLDDQTLAQAETEALTRPSDSSMWDERYYTTHGAALSWADRGDDLVEESNYLTVLAHLREVAGQDADEHVIDARLSHWAYGSLRQLFVQVRDDAGGYTVAFQEATAIAIALRDESPIWDEQDYTGREFERWRSNVLDALSDVQDAGEGDEQLDNRLLDDAVNVLQEDGALDYLGVPERDALTDAYRRARDAYYTTLGQQVLGAQIEGQESLAL